MIMFLALRGAEILFHCQMTTRELLVLWIPEVVNKASHTEP